MNYISVDDLQAFCDNSKDHAIMPNDFQRMNQIKIVRCKDCRDYLTVYCACDGCCISISPEWFCAEGKPKR